MRKNKERDIRATRTAEADGWRVMRFWECELQKDADGAAQHVVEAARRR